MIVFTEHDHKYYNPAEPNRKWTSITGLVSKLKEPFDQQSTARKVSVKRTSKWYGISAEDIIAAWEGEKNRSIELGKWYHNKREQELYEPDTVLMWGVHPPIIENGVKIAPNQRLQEGIYPEHLVYLDSAAICGQSDYVRVQDGKLYIRDYKTSKEIARNSFRNWEGISKKMLKPVQHLECCEYNHYSIQLSLYAYIILRHNPHLELGELVIEHIKFLEDGEDKWGYPIYKLDENGEPVIKEIEEIKVPYLFKEALAIINHHKNQ